MMMMSVWLVLLLFCVCVFAYDHTNTCVLLVFHIVHKMCMVIYGGYKWEFFPIQRMLLVWLHNVMVEDVDECDVFVGWTCLCVVGGM